LAFFKQRIWLDFNKNNDIIYNAIENQVVLKSDFDTISYNFKDDIVIRNKDTLNTKVKIEKIFFQGIEIKQGIIDAISFLEEKEASDSKFIVFKNNDATFFMNQDGF
jgi:hypothetical protein